MRDFLTNLQDDQWCFKNIQDLRELAKPATVIDGQHRLLGASSREQEIPFTFCAIFDCPWEEQVFQFTVVNYTAKRIPDQFITANAAFTLTKSELNLLKTRFEQANIKVLEFDLMEVVNSNHKSPFYSLVNLSEKNNPSKIGYKTMVKIAKVWHSAKHSKIPLVIFPNLEEYDPILKEQASKKGRIHIWSNKYWDKFFLEFWDVIHSVYKDCESYEEGYTLWDVGHSQLMLSIVLYEFQECILNHCTRNKKNYAGDNLEEILSQFRDEVYSIVSAFPADFFALKWKSTGLNTGTGRKLLKDTFNTLVTEAEFSYKQCKLVTG